MRDIKRRFLVIIVCCLSTFAMADDETRILKAVYTPVAGTDVEYGQGAVERCELLHAPLGPVIWLIRVAKSDDAVSWEAKLNAAVDPKHGSFRVGVPDADDLRRVERGEVRFQQ